MIKRSFGCATGALAFLSIALPAVFIIGSAAPSIAQAAEISQAAEGLSAACPDYEVDSVSLALGADRATAAAGSKISLHAVVANGNDFPIVEGSLFVKVTKQGDDVLVDRYAALEGVTLYAQESKTVDFDWNVPSALPAGTYKVEAYFVSAKQFVLSGSDSAAASSVMVKVTSDAKGLVAFDKKGVTLNGAAYGTAMSNAYPAAAPLVFKANLSNATPKSQTVSLVWKLYYWDGISADTLIDERVDHIELAAGKSAPVSYTITDKAHSSYQLVAEAQYSGAKSLVTLRASRSVAEPIVRFIGLKPFPSQNDAVSIFGCVHNTIVSSSQANTITVSLAEGTGKIIDSAAYDISKTPVVGFVRKISLAGVADQAFSLSAVVTDSSKAIRQKVAVVYDCSMVPGSACPSMTEGAAQAGGLSWIDRNAAWVMTTFAALVVVMLLVEQRRRKSLKKKK